MNTKHTPAIGMLGHDFQNVSGSKYQFCTKCGLGERDDLAGYPCGYRAATKHTPGPWTSRVNPSSGYGLHMVEANSGEDTIATQVHPVNASLIAAAPDLLAALNGVLDMLTDNQLQSIAAERARDAIAKSEG
jgi:hypothetical protein